MAAPARSASAASRTARASSRSARPPVYVVAADRYAPKPETMLHDFAHAVPGRWFQMAGMLNGASALSSTLQSIGESDIEGMLHAVERAIAGRRGSCSCPYLTGERTPHNNPDARGVLFGLDPETEKAGHRPGGAGGRRLLAPRRGRVPRSRGQRLPVARASSAAARASRFWAKIIADATGLTLRRYRGADFGPALGAARLAIIAATGASGGREVCFPPEVEEEVAPDPALFEAYTPRYEKYRALYRALAPLF